MTHLPDGQAPLDSYPPQFREAVALARELATGSLREQRAAGTIAAFMFRLMWAEPRAEALCQVADICQQADRDARSNLEQVQGSQHSRDRRAQSYCKGILRVTEAVAINAHRIISAAPEPPITPHATRTEEA